MAYKGINYLKTKLSLKRARVETRYRYYEMKAYATDFGISTPPNLRSVKSVLGWCGKAVDSLADRLVFDEFTEDNFAMNEIYNMNNRDVLFDSAILSAMISSCCFIYISKDDTGYPRLQVIDGSNATGIIDPITNMLTEGYAVLERDDMGAPITELYFISGETYCYKKGLSNPIVEKTNAMYPALVPIIYRPDAKRQFGHSRISRACMDIVKSAMRTVKRSEISAEFYSFPQKYMLGTSADMEIDKWSATMSAMLNITRDEEDNIPSIGQFTQQSMSPHLDQLRMFASLFAGETGLTLDDLGFPSDNPSSAEAIKSSHENLRLTARKAQRTFGSGFLNAGYVAASMRDGFAYDRSQIYLTKPMWEPIFEPDSSMLSSIGDGILKINQAIPNYIGNDNIKTMTGIRKSKNTTMQNTNVITEV